MGLPPIAARASEAPESADRAQQESLVQLLGPALASRVAQQLLSSGATPASGASAPLQPARRLIELSLPEHAHEPFELREPRSSVAIQVWLEGADEVFGQDTGALRVYAGAQGQGSALLLRAREQGVEDYVSLPLRPDVPRLEYRIALAPEIAGLRLVAHTLEFLDAGGAPRLRVTPPEVVGADGARTAAQLAVLGCAVDDNPAAPWGRAPLAPGASSCSVAVSWDSERVQYPALVDPVWGNADSLSQARESFDSLVLPDARVLVAGGLSAGLPSASAELYDPATDSWAVTGSLAGARSAFTLSAQPGSRAIAVGGMGAAGALSSTELYDEASGRWSAGPELPEPFAGHRAVRFDTGDVLIAGASGSARAWRLALDANLWSAAGELLAAEPGSSLTLLQGQDVLLVGPNEPSAQRYDGAGNRWRPSGEPVLARSEHTATRLLDGTVLVVGGSGSRSAELYDPLSESFARVGALNEPRAGHSATLLSDGRVAVIGGNGVPGALGTETYNPAWGTWTSGPGAAQGRSAHRSELLADGQLLAIGGRAPEGGALGSADLLDARVLPTTISEYKLPASLNREITSATFTELWAAVARPTTLVEGRRYPVVLFLHGNHGTCGSGENPRRDFDCTYTERGVCPEGMVVVPSHRGYDYVASELAARGYVVVSVNANRGITCGSGEEGDGGFNLARGRLLLAHLQALSAWDRGAEATPDGLGVSLEGKLDFSEVGMMGHSRGGEGVRAAYEQLRDANSPWPRRIVEPLVFRGIFEIGPVDGQTSRLLNADGVAWNVLLPMCDGDVSNLAGVKPFDRMLGLSSELRETPKSTYVAWGTNHNYFNTEWQTSDSPGCQDHRALFESGPGITGSAEQRQIGLRSMLTFFLANVGKNKNPALGELFDPTSPLELETRVDRGYTPSLRPNRGITLEDFSGPDDQSAHGIPTLQRNLEVAHVAVPEHDPRLRSALLDWSAASGEPVASAASERFLELHFSSAPQGVDLSPYTHLEFRSGRAAADDLEQPTPLLVQLVHADGALSVPLAAERYGVRLDGPVGGPFNSHVVLQTARIPFSDFGSMSSSATRGVRFSFPGAEGARVYLSSVRASLGSASLSPLQASSGTHRPGGGGTSLLDPAPPGNAAPSQVIAGARPQQVRQLVRDGNTVVGLRAVENGRVELELNTRQPFQAQDDQLVLALGDVRTARSRHPEGSLARVIFTLEGQSFANARNGVRMQVGYASNSARQWDFGPLNKAALHP